MKELICLSCSKVIVLLDDPSIGQTVLCPNCNGYFRVTYLSPIILDWVFEDDDEYDEEFDAEFDEDTLVESETSEF